jgi:oxygen-independent coproporphyrinogen-3 oxidase
MLDGGSAVEHTRALGLFRQNHELFEELSEKLTTAVITFLRMQIRAGADAVQIFDSLGGLLPRDLFREGSGKWIERIVREIHGTVPVIVFSKGTRAWSELASLGANVIGIDHGVSLSEAAELLPKSLAVQGNLDPDLLLGSPENAASETRALMTEMNGRHGWIFNLGHGLPPKANLECISAIASALRNCFMSPLYVDLDLVRKYNVAGPRYTSYPPATQFTDKISWPCLAEELIANNREPRDLSLYFHVPFCQSLCWYCGCNTVITKDQGQSRIYLDYLARQMDQMGSIIHRARKVAQLHFGGGTPTFLPPDEILRLGDEIHRRFKIDPQMEAGVEIDPRRLTRKHLSALRVIGFNRASVGVQDVDPAVQEAIHRIQPVELTRMVLNWIRESGFESVNIDLICGLPHQTVSSFAKTIEEVLRMKPDRVALFSYAHVPWLKPSQRALEKALPSAEEKLQILKMAVEQLTAEGQYIYIGMDHFARPEDSLAIAQRTGTLDRNFQGYSTRAGTDIYAFGVSGISQTENAYWQVEKDLPRFYRALDEGRVPLAKAYIMSEDDLIRRETIKRIMCDLSLNFGEIGRQFGINFAEYFAREIEALAPLEADGLVRSTSSGFDVTLAGRLLIRNIAMQFDRYFRPQAEQLYSKTI